MSASEKSPAYTWLLWGTMLAVAFFTAIFAQSQTSARRASPALNTTTTLPEWGISDDEFKSLLLQVETILPIYESSLKDIETYLGKQSDISYQTGKMIQNDIGTLRTDIAGIRRTVSSLRGSRSVLNEIELAEGLFVLTRDAVEIERDELTAPLLETNSRLRFPNITGFEAINSQVSPLALKLTEDYYGRIYYLESQASTKALK